MRRANRAEFGVALFLNWAAAVVPAQSNPSFDETKEYIYRSISEITVDCSDVVSYEDFEKHLGTAADIRMHRVNGAGGMNIFLCQDADTKAISIADGKISVTYKTSMSTSVNLEKFVVSMSDVDTKKIEQKGGDYQYVVLPCLDGALCVDDHFRQKPVHKVEWLYVQVGADTARARRLTHAFENLIQLYQIEHPPSVDPFN